MFGQIANFARMIALRQARIVLRTPLVFRPFGQDLGLPHPAVEIDRNLAHEHLPTVFQRIEELAVAAVQLVERPGRHANPIAQSAIDQPHGDLLFGAKLDFLGDVCL